MIASTSNHPLSNVKAANQLSTPLEIACSRLKAAGLRITQPRLSILDALSKHANPVSIEQLHQDLSGKGCDLVTVYRCLAVFETLGLVRRSFFHNGTSLYESALGHDVRYHVVNRDSGQIENLDEELTEELRKVVAKVQSRLESGGYTHIGHLIEFFGNAPSGTDPKNRLVSSVPAS